METTTHTVWQVKDKNGHAAYSSDGYSKYYERRKLADKGELPAGEEIYGYWQAVDHAMELKRKQYGLSLRICSTTYIETSVIV